MTGASNNRTKSSHPVKIFANIFISFIGAGVLGLPFAFKEAGVLEGLIVMTVVGIVSVKAMLLLVECKYKLLDDKKIQESNMKTLAKSDTADTYLVTKTENGGLMPVAESESLIPETGDVTIRQMNMKTPAITDISYGDVGYYAIGHIGRVFVDVAIVVSQIGFCCAYLIFISENLSTYFPRVRQIHWLVIMLPPLCLLTFLRQLGSLAFTSLLAQGSNLLAFGVVFWFDFEHMHNVDVHPKKMSLKGLPFFLAISIYCYECFYLFHTLLVVSTFLKYFNNYFNLYRMMEKCIVTEGAGMILSLEDSVADEKKKNFRKYFVSTMVLVTSLYISFGCAGYMSFGKETKDIITLNLPKGESIDAAMVVKSFLCLALFCTYPVMMFPVIKIIESYLSIDGNSQIFKGNVLRVMMVIMTGVTVLLIPNFANLMALVGATCCTMLAFTLPGLFHMSIHKGALSIYQVAIDWTLIFAGIVGAVIGTVDALQRLQMTHAKITPVVKTYTLINGTHGLP